MTDLNGQANQRRGERMKWGKRMILGMTVLLALVIAPAALAWHASGVTVQSVCDAEKQTYNITATIEQSEEFPGAFVVSVTPNSLPGDTTGPVAVTVVIGWSDTTDTQTFEASVQVDGTCKPETPPPPPDNGPKDWCPNIDFTQQDGPPPGMVIDAAGNCVPIPVEQPPTTDVVVPPPVTPPPPIEEPPVIVEEEEPEVTEPEATEPEVIEEAPATEEAPEVAPSPKPVPPKAEELPFTGGPSWPAIVAGLALIAAGIGMRRLGER